MAKPNKPEERTPAQTDTHKREKRRRELLRKLPEETQPAEEWGERLDTAKTIATGGKDTVPDAEDNRGG